jgi:hypothetical protein
MVTKIPNILISDENGSRVLEGEELNNFLAQQSKDLAEEENWKAKSEADYEAKVAARNQIIERLDLNQEEANLVFPPISKPLHLL